MPDQEKKENAKGTTGSAGGSTQTEVAADRPGESATEASNLQPANKNERDTGLVDKAKDTANAAYGAAAERASAKLAEHKTNLSAGLSSVADTVRQAGENLKESDGVDNGLATGAARYTDAAARKLESLADYFEAKDWREMVRDVEDFARRNPLVFFGTAFGLGLVAARFLKSSPPSESQTNGREQRFASFKSPSVGAAKSARTSSQRNVGETM